MSLPRIASYPMPSAAELPSSRVDWRPDPGRAALLIHDMQRYFLAPFDADAAPIPELLANITALRERCRELGMPVIYCAQPGGQTPQQRGLLSDFWGDGIPSGDGQAIVDDLAPADGELRVTKWRYSAFVRTDLDDRLRALGRDQLLICGIYAHIGCMTTAVHAFMHDVQPFLVADALADFSLDHHRMALRWSTDRCAAATTTRRLLDVLPDPIVHGAMAQIHNDVAAALEIDPADLRRDDDLVDLGLDSITLVGLVTSWRARDIDVDFEHLAECEPSIAAWARAIDAMARRPAGAR